MNKELDFFALFDQFISESKSGKRLKKDGTKMRMNTVERYSLVRKEIFRFSKLSEFKMRIKVLHRLNARELKSENVYWKRFYRKYSNYLYSIGCFDNYVGAHFKVLRTFFNYLKKDKAIFTGDVHSNFYIRTENIPITVLSPDQLQFLIYNSEFENSLPAYLKRAKDIFVFGCTVGLRFSDLMNLTNKNIEKTSNSVYLKVRSMKTSTDTRVKLPDYALQIISKYKGHQKLLPQISNNRLNLILKELCLKVGWTYEIGKKREKKGVAKEVTILKEAGNNHIFRFCDLVTTHTMRRTAITTLLTLGMPEIMVRNISGHSSNSKEFYKYVSYAQQFIDMEIDKVHLALKNNHNKSLKIYQNMLNM